MAVMQIQMPQPKNKLSFLDKLAGTAGTAMNLYNMGSNVSSKFSNSGSSSNMAKTDNWYLSPTSSQQQQNNYSLLPRDSQPKYSLFPNNSGFNNPYMR